MAWKVEFSVVLPDRLNAVQLAKEICSAAFQQTAEIYGVTVGVREERKLMAFHQTSYRDSLADVDGSEDSNV